jgi:hypothetical protein
MNDDLKAQSNPFSTGGGGVNFETRVQASFAVALLAGSPLPCLPPSAKAQQIKFQNKYEGVQTDDFVVVAGEAHSTVSRLYAQVKHEITISDAEDSMFAQVVKGAWADFTSATFDPQNDAIALITGPLPKLDVSHTLPVLEWARYSANADEFIRKSLTKGFTSKAKLERLRIFKSQLQSANDGQELSDHQLWSFLKIFYLLSYDVDAKASVVASLLGALIQCHSTQPSHLVLAKVITTVQEFNQNGGTLNLDNAPPGLAALFVRPVALELDSDIERLRDRGERIVSGISNSINGMHIHRDEQLAAIADAYDPGGFLFVTGGRGAGKSGIVKDFVSVKLQDTAVFYLRAEDLDKPHLNDVFTAFGMRSTLSQIAGQLALLSSKVLVIESVEKILELHHQSAFIDLLNFIKGQQGWTIIATGRDYAYQQLTFNYLQPSGIAFSSINIEGFSKDQVGQLCEQTPELNALISNELLFDILKIPFFIDLAVRAIGNGAHFNPQDTEAEFRTIVWDSVIAKNTERKAGMPGRRKATFIAVAKLRAKRMVFGVRDVDFDAEVIAKLEEDHLIHRDPRTSLISPSHDVLEDWALEKFIEGEYIDSEGHPVNFLTAIGNEPAINRGFRLWLHHKLKSREGLNGFLETILTDEGIESFWKDEAIAAVLQCPDPQDFLMTLKPLLLQNKEDMLIRFFFILRITCQRPVEGDNVPLGIDEKTGLAKVLLLRPYGDGWNALVDFTYAARQQLTEPTCTQVAEVLSTWCEQINIWEELPHGSQCVGLLALFLLERVKDDYRRDSLRKKILKVLLKVSAAVEQDFNALVEHDVFRSKKRSERPSYVDELIHLALLGDAMPMLCMRSPDLIIRLALHEWMRDKPEPDPAWPMSRLRLDVEESYGLDVERGFSPASGGKGPFKYLLMHHPRKGLDFIINLCNATAQKHAESEFGPRSELKPDFGFTQEMAVEQVELQLADGHRVLQYASPHLWKGYRGHSTLPGVLQCAMMALENWLFAWVNACTQEREIVWLYDYVLRSSNSVMPTSVLASVAVACSSKVGASALPLLRSFRLYSLDLQRKVEEMGGAEMNWFGTMMHRDVMAKFYAEERREAALRPWRAETLEELLVKLQFHESLRGEAVQIVDAFIAEAEVTKDSNLRFMIHRVDTRDWEAVEDRKNNRLILQSSAALPEDLQQVQSEFNDKHSYDSVVQRLYVWSRKAFDDLSTDTARYATYQDAIAEARGLIAAFEAGKVLGFQSMAVGAITTTAAVCIRDAGAELSAEDKEWCFEIILDTVCMHADNLEDHSAVDATDQHGAAACAFVLAKIFDFDLHAEDVGVLEYVIITALTHANLHVCASAAKGVRAYLWPSNHDFASRCLAGVVEHARFRMEKAKASRHHHYGGDVSAQSREDWSETIARFRDEVLAGHFPLSVEACSLESHAPWLIHLPMLLIPNDSQEDDHIRLLKKIVGFVYEDQYREPRQGSQEKIHYEIKKQIQDCLAEHVVHSKNRNFEPVRDVLRTGCSKAPTFTYLVKLSFDIAMEKKSDFDAIWTLWRVIAPELHAIAATEVNDPYAGHQHDLNTLLRGMLYSDSHWQRHPSETACLRVGTYDLLDFVRTSGHNSHVFEALSSLMYNFHELFFEDGIFILAEKFSADTAIISRQLNTAFYLEMSMARYLQIENRAALTRNMYKACLGLLTGLVETGSARAYYLRENLIRTRRVSF